MRSFLIKPVLRVNGKIGLLGDKSITHRLVIASALCRGKTSIENFPSNKDCLSTVKAFKKLGIKITAQKTKSPSGTINIQVFGKGIYGLRKPKSPIFVGDSGTTLRLLLGVLAGQEFKTKLVAGKSLSRRPMLRVTAPLRMMGAKINAKRKTQNAKVEEYPPIVIKGGNLKPITYKLPIASAQVKSAIILAGLFTKGTSCIIEPVATRDHTERILRLFKSEITIKKNKIFIKGEKELNSPGRIYVPGDISSGSFFIVLATILQNSRILVKNVSLNPSRIGIIRALKRMGANIKVHGSKFMVHSKTEPMGDLLVRSSKLKGATIRHNEVPSLIDELPILMVAACNAQGKTVFEGVSELRVKETDRINSLSLNLKKMGADISVVKKGDSERIVIRGGKRLKGAKVRSFADHRTAMSMVVAGLNATGQTQIDDISCINKSFPNFLGVLRTLIR